MANAVATRIFTHRYGVMLPIAILGIAFALLLPETAIASSNASVESILCELVTILQGITGKAIATVAFSGLGLMALFGKIDKNLAGVMAIGLALLMGAVSVVPAIGGSSSGCSGPAPAPAFSCSNGAATGNSNLFTIADNTTYANLNTATSYSGTGGGGGGGTCDTIPGVFGRVLCEFKANVGQIMSTMYCSFQQALLKPLSIALTLFVVIFGVLIVTGIVDFTLKEAGLALFKIALVWAFAMNADWGIGIAYRFFMGAAEEGSNIVLQSLGQNVSLSQLDTTLANTFNYTTGATATGATSTGIASLSPYCAKFLAYAAALMVFFLPIGTVFVGGIVVQYALLYAKAILGYLTVLVLISFLFILSPLFISFALFKTTYKLFEKWVQYLTTFAVQMVVVFALLAMCQLVLGPFTTFLNTTLGLVREYDGTWSKWFVTAPFHICSICKYTPNPITNPIIDYSTGSTGTAGSSSITCDNSAPNSSAADASAYVQGFDKNGQPVSVIPLVHLLSHNDLMLFIVSNVVALWLIANILSEFLKRAPELARQLGGLPFAPSILGGPSPTADIPSIKYPGMDALGASLKSATNSAASNPVSRTLIAAVAGLGAEKYMNSSSTKDMGTTSTSTPSSAPKPSTVRTNDTSAPTTSTAAAPAPESVAAASAAPAAGQTLSDLQNTAMGAIRSIDKTVATPGALQHLSESDIQQIKSTVSTLTSQLQATQTEQGYNNIINQLYAIQRKLRG